MRSSSPSHSNNELEGWRTKAGPAQQVPDRSFQDPDFRMIPSRQFKPVFVLVVATAAWFAGSEQARASDPSSGDAAKVNTAPAKPPKIAGKWRISWDVRLGTVRGILDLKQTAQGVAGSFEEYGKSYPVSGIIQGKDITFEIPFDGPRPYTIEFRGTIEGGKMSGTSALKGGAQGFLGHAGEVDEPDRPWIATRGLTPQNEGPPGRPPTEDDDDRPRKSTKTAPI